MSFLDSRRRRTALLGFHVVGLLAVAGLQFNWHRIPIAARDPESRPGWPRSVPSTAALVVDREILEIQARRPPPFSQRDWGLAWRNTLFQEIGPSEVLDLRELATTDLLPFRLLILSAGAVRAAPRELLPRLEAWVVSGGALVVELPNPAFASLTGVEADASGRSAARLCRGLQAVGGFFPDRLGLDALPLYTRTLESIRLAPDVQVLARLEAQPAVVERRVGEGLVLGVCFDWGLFLTATQQGRPEEDYRIGSRYTGLLSEKMESNDLMAAPEYHDNPVPIADILERALVSRVRRHVFVPALWYWPEGAPGIHLMTHDDERLGDRTEWMLGDEQARGVPATVFYIPDPGPHRASVLRVREGGHGIGLHWDRDWREVSGMPRLGPFMAPVPLAEQVGRLKARLPEGAPVLLHRSHYLRWDPSFSQTFARLEAAGIALDTSYGPDFGCKGYLFGTGYPFHPSDVGGMPFRLLELPYQHSETEGGADAAYLTGLAEASRSGDHAALVSLFHPSFWGWIPSVDVYQLWRNLPRMLAEREHPAFSLERTLAFMRARENSKLAATLVGPRTWQVNYAVAGEESGLWLVVPERLGEADLASVPAGSYPLVSQGGTRWTGIPLSGSGSVRIAYGELRGGIRGSP